MTRLDWGNLPKNYERGVDRGVLYFPVNEYAAWDGLISVQEQTQQSKGAPRWFDGVVYSIDQDIADFSARIDAYTYPYMLEDHILALHTGQTLSATAYETSPFGFTYRTERLDGYKIHLVYNIIATMDAISHSTLDSDINLKPFSFTFHTTPIDFPNARPTSHVYIDTTIATKEHVFELEKILYGSEESYPRFPQPTELLTLFNS